MEFSEIQPLIQKIRANIAQVMVGKQDALDLLLIALFSHGHVLLEDVPGIGKTTLVSALAKSLGLTFKRIQFTPDVMPSDITGFNLYNQKCGQFDFHPGAVMSQLILADEINRTSPKTQSSLLEAMQENQVTVDGTTYPVPQPFMVMATQNPVEQVGTFALPEAQLDRFMLKISLGYPSVQEEMAIYERFAGQSPLNDLQMVVDAQAIIDLQATVLKVYCAESIRHYIARLALATRQHPDLALGLSPRGALMLMLAARGRALLLARDFILPDDVLVMAPMVINHRLLIKPEARLRRVTISAIVDELLQSVPVPQA
jgi:MoxR-like ATPase